MRSVSESHAERIATQNQNQTHKASSLRSEASAAAPTFEWSGQDGAIAWAEFSSGHAREAGIAGRRFAAYMDRLPLPALWYAVAEAAAEGHHAAGSLIEPYLRSRCARIGEALREQSRAEERTETQRGEMKHIGALLSQMGVKL